MTAVHIGIDSTDSADLGMCTTYLGAVLLERLSELPATLAAYPELIRLNPNVPWKTRGNGAVCLRYSSTDGAVQDMIDITERTIDELSIFEDPQTNPGLAVLSGDVPQDLVELYRRSLHEIIGVDEALGIGRSTRCYMKGWKNKRGLIGALSAIGSDLAEHTYEAIQYRPGSIKDPERNVDSSSIIKASKEHPGIFFNSNEEGDPVCIPRSPCPVILGIRSMDPSDAVSALGRIELQDAERWVLWKTNQHTDSHIEMVPDISNVKPLSSIKLKVKVIKEPQYFKGGHLVIGSIDRSDTRVDLAAYEPTKRFRVRLSNLIPGDELIVWGSVRTEDVPETTINLEKVYIEKLADSILMKNPSCPVCDGPTESMGKGQGLRCKRCRYRGAEMVPIETKLLRKLDIGPLEPPMDVWRHLYKPFELPEIVEKPYNGPYWGIGTP